MEIILHLTDLHFGSEGDKPSSQAQRKICLDSLLAELAKLDSTWKPTFICITGDLVWRGAGSDYDQAKQWLDKLLLACELTYEQLIICVGNHEVDRKLAERLPRPSNAEEADSTLALPLPDFLQQPFLNFIKFCEANNIPILNFGDTESYLIGIREYRGIKFLILNSCWFSKDNQDKGKLWMGFPHLQYMEANSQLFRIQPDHVSPPVTIALMHHPVTWLHEEEQHAFQTRPNTWDYLAMRCDVLLTGHTHGESRRADQIAEGARHFTGGATYADANYFNSFRLLKIEHENIVYRTFDFNPRSADIAWKPSNAVSLPIRQQIQATQASPQVVLVDATDKLREALRADAERQRDRKSRLLRPTGSLPSSVPQQVSLQVSRQIDHFDSLGRMLREDKSEYVMPLYEAVRESRRTLLLGDLGTGKSTLAAQLVIETLDRSVTTVAVLLPVKNLKLPERLSLQDLLQSLDAYISGEVMPDKTPPKLFDLLQSQTEVLVVFDGLDELSRDCAGRLLSVAAKLTEHWPTIQIVATARPVEMHGVSFADWQLIHTTALQETGKFQFLLEELIADGVPPELAKDEAQALLRVLKELPTLNSLTVTPLVIRMIYPRLDSATTQTSFSLGDLLYELLIERLNGWQQRDDKPVNFTDFEAALPTAEAKAEFLAVLAQKNASGISITSEAARSSLMDAAAKLDKVNPHALVDQALTCFKWLGLIALSDVLEFPLQPLAEMAAAIALVKRWREEGTNNYLPNNNEWRIVSFAAAMIRRRLWLDELIQPLKGYIGQLLQNPHNVPAACYVVVEANDANYAKYLIQAFSRLGYHPLVPFEDERIASSRNIAKALWLAGTEGFDWLFGQYLDPKYPLPHAGSRTIHDVFYQWAKFAQGNLDTSQKQRLSTMVMPYLATGEANFFGVLGMLSLLVPEAFGLKDRLWYQLYELDSPTFGDGLLSQIRLDFFDPNTRPLLEKILLHRAPESAAAALLWLELNPDSEPPVEIIRASFRYLSKTVIGNAAITLSIQCRQRLGQERWLRFARWMLSDGDNSVACGAALTLHEVGENRLSLLGDVFMRAMHDGGYMAVAEKIMAELINGENDKGINWLINRLEKKSDSRFGGHSGYWRLLLANIARVEDGPDKLAGCLQALGQFVLPRYPEVREAFSRLLNGSNGSAYRHALRKRLHDLDPTIRSNAARILVATDPGTESEALFVTVRSRAVGWHHDLQEWESFCLTLDFSPAVLGFLQSHMNLLEPQSIAFAWVLLAKGKLIELDFQTDWINTLFDLGNWHLLHDPICQDMLSSKEALAFLVQQLAQPNSSFAKKVTGQLLRSHRTALTAQVEAQCILVESQSTCWPKSFTEQMIRLANDVAFRLSLIQAYEVLRNQGCNSLPLGLVAQAIQGDIPWKEALWAMFVAELGAGIGDQAETFGSALLQFGSIKQEYRQAIGQAAIHCMDDSRTKATRWIENYHWLALIADEFIGLEAESIREVLKHASGRPIHCAAAAALLARLGEMPDGVRFERGVRNRPDLSGFVNNENIEANLFQRLLDYGRDAEKLHEETLKTIEKYLYLPQPDESVFEKLTAQGKPGILISTALRFCYGTDPKLLETLPLLSEWARLWHNLGQNRQLERLMQIWMSSREAVLRENSYAAEQYLEALDKDILIGNHWILPLATEILNIRKSLLPSQINTTFSEYAKHHTFLHERLFEQLATWLSGDLDSVTREAVLEAVHAPLVVLGESYSSENCDNSYALLLFPCVHWALGGEQTQTAQAIFLQGMRSVLNKELTSMRDAPPFSMSTVLAKLEPLLKKVPHAAIASTIETGLTSPDLASRAFCYIVDSFAKFCKS